VVNGVVEIPFPGRLLRRGSGPGRPDDHTMALSAFVAGPENGLVPVAVELAINDGARPYSPIVFHGPPGTGKSHLALGLAAAWKACCGRGSVLYATAVDFARQLADAIQTKTLDEFTGQYRQASLLILEDVGRLAGKQAAQRELIFTLDGLTNAGNCAVLTANAAPGELTGIVPGLRSRLAAGLTVPLAPPGRDARLVILRCLAELRRANLSDLAGQALADGLDVTVPELFAVLTELAFSVEMDGGVISIETARRYLAQRKACPAVSVHKIALATARCFSLTLAELRSPSRRRAVAAARGVAMYLARRLTEESLDDIGRYFGGRDHTTVSYGCRKTEERLGAEPDIRDAVLTVQQTLERT